MRLIVRAFKFAEVQKSDREFSHGFKLRAMSDSFRNIWLCVWTNIKHVFNQSKWFWNFASLVKAFFSWNILYTKWTAATSLEAAGCFSWKRFRFVGGSSSWNDSKADKGWMGSVTSVVEQKNRRSSTVIGILHRLKVHIFWEGHKILRNLHLTFVLCSASQK